MPIEKFGQVKYKRSIYIDTLTHIKTQHAYSDMYLKRTLKM